MTQRSVLGWIVASVLMLSWSAWAVEYRLQIANLDFLTVSAYTDRFNRDNRVKAAWSGSKHGSTRWSSPASAVIPGRDMLLLQDPAYGGKIPDRVSVLPTTKEQAWTTFVWDANPGDTVGFVVKSDMPAWQEAWFMGANPEGTLRRLRLAIPRCSGAGLRSPSGLIRFSRQRRRSRKLSELDGAKCRIAERHVHRYWARTGTDLIIRIGCTWC